MLRIAIWCFRHLLPITLEICALLLILPNDSLAQFRPEPNSLIVWRANAQTSGEVAESIVAQGGRIDHVFPPNAVIAYIPSELAEKLKTQIPGIRIEQGEVPPANISDLGGAATVATSVWNEAFQAPPLARERPAKNRVPREPANDARIAPDRLSQPGKPRARAAPVSAAPGFFETSEFLIGSVTVGIITPESNGAIDANTENWSVSRQNTVVAKIVQAMQWWKDNASAPANLTFVYDIHHGVPTSYEPIKRSSNDEDLWISQVMSNLGYAGTPSTYFTQVRQYLNATRASMGTDWAFAVFVVDSLKDANGAFANGDFAYTYVNGPFTVMTYDNDGWGIDRMQIVAAHETGHIWGALDEYASSDCTDTEISGYLNIANSNCENGNPAAEDSIMRNSTNQENVAFPNHLVSTPARQMIGWRDTDGDGKELYDPVDTIPVVSLISFTPDPTTNPTPTYSGVGSDPPYPSPTGPDVTINRITGVEWRVDGGAWQAATATDGFFNSDVENFNFTASSLPVGTHTIQVRATNTVGNKSALASDTLTIVNPLPVVTIVATNASANEDGTNGRFTVSRTGSTAQSIIVAYTTSGTATMGADYKALTGSVVIPSGAASADILIESIDDIVSEQDESVILTLSANASYVVGAQNSASVTVTDNDSVNPVAHVDCVSMSLQNVIEFAQPGSTIFVSGVCAENITIRNAVERLALDGGNQAQIATIDSTTPALNVRGKGILIRGFTITGGSAGIHVNRGASAVIDGNVIRDTNGNGIVVDESAFAALTNNVIQNNPGAGVFVSENSTARIGFNSDTETVASPNLIQNNGIGGVLVSNGSSARLIGNTVTGNTGDGVFVVRDSQSDLASNVISNNGGNGVEVSEKSVLQLGEESGGGVFESSNSGSGNLEFGIQCGEGSVVDGRQGTLTGTGGVSNFDATCVSHLAP